MNITTISGIVSCYIYEHEGKKYYLFGDKHYTRKNNCRELGYQCDYFDKTFTKTFTYGTDCTTIGALLHNWFTYNNDYDIMTDFYIELFYTKEHVRENHKTYNDIIENRKSMFHIKEDDKEPFKDKSWMEMTYYIMKPCFVREKDKCPYYPNVHVHYTDVRNVDVGDITSVNPFEIDNYHHMEYVKLLFLQYKVILSYLLDVDGFDKFLDKAHLIPEEFRDNLVDNMTLFTVIRDINGREIRMYKTAWELYRLEQVNPMIAQQLRMFVYNEANNIMNRVMNILRVEKINYDRYNDLLLDVQSLSMDVYTLSRVFVQNESEEVVIYAGAYHIRFYADFFQSIGFTLLDSVPYKKGQNCIKMDLLPIFLNGNKYRQYTSTL